MKSSLRRILLRARMRLALWRTPAAGTLRAGDPNTRHVFVALAADYGNLGDLAITYAQVRFLQRTFPDYSVEPIPISKSLSAIKHLKRAIGPEDVITLIGGGNTGDMYDDIQYLRELFIKNFPKHRILSFPQTIDFSDTAYGRWAMHRAARVYNRHDRLAVMARDSQSQERAEALFGGCSVVVAPDVVLTVEGVEPPEERHGVLVALRSDLESGLDDATRNALIAAARSIGSIRHRDTHVGDVRLTQAAAEQLLAEYWRDWRSAEIVVTDRLHGMIFAVITGTPCIALDSCTGKVGQFYKDWLVDHEGVTLLDHVDEDSLRSGMRSVRADSSGSAHLLHLFGEAFADSAVSVALR